MALKVLRKISTDTLHDLHDPTGEYHYDPQTDKGIPANWLYLDARQPWFRHGYVDNDAPRPTAVTDSLMKATEGFALWDTEQRTVVRDGIPDLGRAEKMRASARTTFNVDFDIPAEDADSSDESE